MARMDMRCFVAAAAVVVVVVDTDIGINRLIILYMDVII